MGSPHSRRCPTFPFTVFTPLFAVAVFSIILINPCSADRELLNVSYDPTREFYREYNVAFSNYWKEKTKEVLTIKQSHGGSGKQARSVIDGLKADVVTLAIASDVDALVENGGFVAKDWQSKFPANSAPYWSTIVFLVRKGNPKKITDWGDLVKGDVKIITPNPKTSGGARWNYLSAWLYALKKDAGGYEELHVVETHSRATAAARKFVTELYRRVPVLDSGARGATTTFIERGIGDVLLTWENEAFLAMKELGPDKVEMVVPSISIKAEPVVAVVDRVVDAHTTRDVATEYLRYLYSKEGQTLAARHFYRPSDATLADPKDMAQFAKIETATALTMFGGWAPVQLQHFGDGGIFDQIYIEASGEEAASK